VAASISLYRNHGLNVPYCFNRKEKKDHGEGGNIIGYSPKNGDRILIIEDVTTAGTSIRESVPLLKAMADVQITSLVVSVDRMEKGLSERSALQEVAVEFGMKVKAIVTIAEILSYLYEREIDGKVLVDKAMKEKIEDYLKQYGC
jgi:orotate phosphoribosyltransferase